MHSARVGNTATATALLAADSTLVSSPVQTHYNEPIDPLSDAIVQGDSLDVILTLIQLGSSVNPENTLYNKKPLHKAGHYLRLDVAELLLQHGADATAASTSGWCAYHNAILQLFNVHSYNVNDEPPERDSPKDKALQTVRLLVRSFVHASSAAVDIETAKCPSKPGTYFTADMQQFAKQQLQQAVAQCAAQQQQQAAHTNSSAVSDGDSTLHDGIEAEQSFSSSSDGSAWLNSSMLAGSSAYTDAYSSSSSGSSSSNSMVYDGVDFSAEMLSMGSSTTTTTATTTTAVATVVTTAAAAITTATVTAAAAAADADDIDADAEADADGWDVDNIDMGDIDIDALESLLDSANDADSASEHDINDTNDTHKRPRLG
jgi:hypothetical protein